MLEADRIEIHGGYHFLRLANTTPTTENTDENLIVRMIRIPQDGDKLVFVYLPIINVLPPTGALDDRMQHLPNVEQHWLFHPEGWIKKSVHRYVASGIQYPFKTFNDTYYVFKTQAANQKHANQRPIVLLDVPFDRVEMFGDGFIFKLADDQEFDADGRANYVDIKPDVLQTDEGQMIVEAMIMETSVLEG
ncbi:hypothetical protein MMC28_001198 [Mycoblastus sanguinarius]|nr:hypothetical protein [Mycoblastus sanguinarius]